MDLAAAEEEERQEGRVKTNVFAYVMSCLVNTSIFTFTFISCHLFCTFTFTMVKTNVFAYVMSCLVYTYIFTFTFINCHLFFHFH